MLGLAPWFLLAACFVSLISFDAVSAELSAAVRQTPAAAASSRFLVRPVWPLVTAAAEITPTHGISETWGMEIQVSESTGVNTGGVGRKLAIDAQGRLHAVWTHNTGTAYDVYYTVSNDGGGAWSMPRDITNSSLPALSPNIAVGPNDLLHVTWVQKYVDGFTRISYQRSADGGATWSAPIDVSGAAGRDVATASLSADTEGRVHVAWHLGNVDTDATPTAVYYARSIDGGQTFEPPKRLNTADAHAAWPRFSVEGATGDLIAIPWRDNRRNPDWDVYLAISTDGGATFTERPGVATSQRDWDPDALVAPNGVIHLTYMTQQITEDRVGYTYSSDGGVTWSAPFQLSEVRGRLSTISRDPRRNLLWILWKDERDAIAARSDLIVRFSTDGGATWLPAEFITDLGDVDPLFPSIAVGPDGHPHVMWSDQRRGDGSEIVYVKNRSAAPGVIRLPVVPNALR